MEVRKDRDGVPYYYGDGGDVKFPPFPLPYSYQHQVSVIRQTRIRDDDIIMTGYPKSGSHWHYEMVSMLQRGVADYLPTDKAAQMVDRLTREQTDQLPSPRVLNTHVPFHHLPAEAFKKQTKFVYLLRNPKDIAVSLYHHARDWTKGGYTGSWPEFLRIFMHEGFWTYPWFECVPQFTKQIENHPDVPFFIAVYEEAIKDPVGHVQRLNRFLGVGRSEELCAQIAKACSFQNLKTANAKVKTTSFEGIWAEGSPGFFRKGIVGEWENWFTKEQSDEFDALYAEAMKDSKLNVIFKL